MIKETDDGILFDLKVIPKSSKNDIIYEGDVLKLKITALPIDNKANKVLVEYLSKYLKVPKSSIDVVKGQTTKEKKIFINVPLTAKRSEIMHRINNIIKKQV